MPTGVFLVNGIRISFNLIETAIQWAQENNGTLTGLYIYNDEKNAESYGFPSDIERVETQVTENEGEDELEALIRKNIAYAEKQCASKNIPVTTFQLKDPVLDALRYHLQTAAIVWADPDAFEGEAEADVTNLSLEDIRGLTDAEVVEISSQ